MGLRFRKLQWRYLPLFSCFKRFVAFLLPSYPKELSRTICLFLYPHIPAAARRRQGGRLTRPHNDVKSPRGETMLASLLTLAWFRPLSAVLFGASAGGDAPHRTPPQRRPLPPAFCCKLKHNTVQEGKLTTNPRPALWPFLFFMVLPVFCPKPACSDLH